MSDIPAYCVPQAESPDHEIVSSRTIPFARACVFAAWAHPELHAQWWGPAGFTNTFYNYDVRPGGDWRFTMHGPDGTDYANHHVFEHVADGECIVCKHVTEPQFTVVAHFTDDGEGTRLEWHMIFDDAKVCAAIREFVGDKNEENFERLETLLRETPADALPFRELVVMREIDAPPEVVYRVLTTRTKEWWCPQPWTTPVVEWDLRAGGRCHTVMRGPEGEEHDVEGVFLEVTENERIVFTDGYRVGWEPTTQPFMTGIFDLKRTSEGKTSYRGIARHWTHEAHAQHVTMGFRAGWGLVSDQIIAVAADELRHRAGA